MPDLRDLDPNIWNAIQAEEQRQSSQINLIASENFTSTAIREATGSVLTNKYAEGYPARRYYGGCENADTVENIAIQRAKDLFGAEHANVQPHSGSQANMGVYFSTIVPGDTILSMDLAHGGHLSHGHPKNFSGAIYNIVFYGVDRKTERIDFDELAKKAKESKPKIIVAGASAYPRFIAFDKFRQIADDVGAILMVDMAHIAGLVAAKLHPDPFPYADFVTTTTHKTLRGPRGGIIFCKEKYRKAINSATFPGMQGGPLMHVIAAKAVALKEAASDAFRDYQSQTLNNTATMAETLKSKGYRIVSGGTDNHLFLVDLTEKGTTGAQAERALNTVGIVVNKNMIPFDTKKPMETSGLRIGTPTITTRGMKEAASIQIAELIDTVLANLEDEAVLKTVKAEVEKLCAAYPVPE